MSKAQLLKQRELSDSRGEEGKKDEREVELRGWWRDSQRLRLRQSVSR